MIKKQKFSEETLNRISIWNEVLCKAYSYLIIEKSLNKYNANSENYISFEIANKTFSVHKELNISQALIEAAIVNFWQIFTTGIEGTGISSNQGNSEIDKIRMKMKFYTIGKLGWSDKEFSDFYNLLKTKRNGLLAHYDGVVGNFKELEVGIESRMSPGINLLEKEKIKLEQAVKTMFEYIFNFLYSEK